MRILLDADGCPVVDLTLQIARAHQITAIILCDSAHEIQREGFSTITVPKGADSVDFTLVNRIQPGDIVITQDYGLAAMSLARRAIPVSQNGLVYNDANIDSLLHARYTAQKIRRGGGRFRGPAKRTADQDRAFVATLTRLVNPPD